ncbi:DNA polymerase III beta subunit [Candidatus Vidania fulgoroideae]|uniref:Beta sliding clamp n=1 Tax=Candidatus Vidania fulgoroideorum TaxID=881286 RepID=A0A346E0L1_9PROT|nr:DNA polymerase III beta subunit [Candidatus Vidania fulgoroideae]
MFIYFFSIIDLIPKKQIGKTYLNLNKNSKIYFCNKYIKIECELNNSIEENININFKYESLSKIIKTIYEKEIVFIFKKKKIYFNNETFKLLILTKKIKKEIKIIKNKKKDIIIENNDMIKILKSIIFVFRIEQNIFNGVYFNIKKKKIEIISCDNFRFSFNEINFLSKEKIKNKEFYIKETYIKLLIKTLKKNKKTHIGIKKKSLVFFINKFTKFEIKIYNNNEFDYKSISKINSENKLAEIEQNSFLKALKRAKILCKNKNKYVNLIIKKNNIIITSNNLEKRIFIEKIYNTFYYKKKKICFNIEYLIDFVSIFKNEKIILFYNKKKNIAIFKISNNVNYKYMLMPIEYF